MEFNGKFWLKSIAYILIILIIIVIFYAFIGWYQARSDAQELQQIAQDMRDNGLSVEELGESEDGENRAALIIRVEDPNFYEHGGYDLSTAGAGQTTITQSLAKNLAFDDFKPGYQKIRQTAYAIGLEGAMSKDDIFILFLNTVQMGRFPTGWIEGLHRAAKLQYRKDTAELTDDEFIELVAVMIAPGDLRLDRESAERDERVERIKRLLANECTPIDHGDVWLDGCAA